MTESSSTPRQPEGAGGSGSEKPEYLSFDRVALDYDWSRSLPLEAQEEAARLLHEQATLTPDKPWLDAGAGTGRFALPLARLGVQVVGLDISESMLAQLRRKSAAVENRPHEHLTGDAAQTAGLQGRRGAEPLPLSAPEMPEPPLPLRLARADLRRMPLASHTFQAVLIVHILHLIADWQAVLTEAQRVLAPGGVLFLAAESGRRVPTRDIYLDMADTRRPDLREPLGARNVDAARQFLHNTGARIEQVDADRVHWIARWRVRETLEMLRRRIWSHMWTLSEGDHTEIMAATEDWARKTYGGLDAVEETETLLRIWAVRWGKDES